MSLEDRHCIDKSRLHSHDTNCDKAKRSKAASFMCVCVWAGAQGRRP